MTVPGERDFVSSPIHQRSAILRSMANDIDEFIMSGGLGEMTVTPVEKPKSPSSRSRSRSSASSEDSDVPLTKRRKIETIDLTSSP